MKNKYIIYILAVIGSSFLPACEDFLEVTPRATVSDDKLFQDQAGFEQALNGVYSAFAAEPLYGNYMTMGYLSALAKNYDIQSSTHNLYRTNAFDYENSSYVSAIWSNAYAAIATLNNILEKIEGRKPVFTDNNYKIIRGEALALRAYLHFDLLRLFGQNYQSDPFAEGIPYRTEYTLAVKGPNTNQKVVELALKDLDEAEELLSDDPITNENMNRRYRMNYYAILSLKARIYNYTGDNENATKFAQQVVDSQSFPFVEESAISTSIQSRKDRLFTPELIFALRVKDVANWAEGATSGFGDFRFSYGGSLNNTLTLPDVSCRDLFESNINPEDYRYKYLFEVDDKSSGAGSEKYPSKYWQTWEKSGDETSKDRKDQTVPLIRISEMYYILANHAPTIDQALDFLNTVRTKRGIILNLSSENIHDKILLREEITKEYQKEFYAEGQTFFWYKQIGATTIKLYTGTVTPKNYVFPIPVTELEFNSEYK